MTWFVPSEKELNFLLDDFNLVFRKLIESIKVGVYMADAKGKLFFVNEAFVDILGYNSKTELLGLNLALELYIDVDDREKFLNQMSKFGYVKDFEARSVRKDGSIAILSTTSHYIRNDHNKMVGFQGVVYEITEKKKLEENLKNEKMKLEQILNYGEGLNSLRSLDQIANFVTQEIVSVFNVQKCSLMLMEESTNELYIRSAIGLTDDIIGQTKVALGDGISGKTALEAKPLLVENIEYDRRFERKNKPYYTTESFMSVPIISKEKVLGVINVTDKTTVEGKPKFTQTDLKILNSMAREVAATIENLKIYDELKQLSVIDPITNIYNFRQMTDSLDHEIIRIKRNGHPLTFLMIDVDDFKQYNDTFGHQEGDYLLRTISQLFKKTLRQEDIVCRYAGDEFSIILIDTNAKGGNVVAEKIREVVSRHSFKMPITLSIGVCECAPHMARSELILAADRALYKAKNLGKNQVFSHQ